METTITASLIKAVSGEFDTESVYKLSLCRMNIKSLENMYLCPNLTELNLTANEITKPEGLEACTALKKLTLTSNRITILDHFAPLHSIEHLFLQDNQISDPNEITKLTTLVNLKTLYFKNIDGTQKNPLCGHPSYRTVVLRSLPTLTNLDGERLRHAEYSRDLTQPTEAAKPAPSFEIPQPEPWLKDYAWDDCFADVDEFIKKTEEKFKAAVTDAKKLNANALALLSHYE